MECLALLNVSVPFSITERKVRSRRKKGLEKTCFCYENSYLPKKKRNSISATYPKQPNDCESNVKIIRSKLIKPCSVNLTPLHPIIYATYKAYAVNSFSLNYLSLIKNKKSVDLNDSEQVKKIHSYKDEQVHSVTDQNSVGTPKKIIENVKPCSVVLEKINLNDLSRFFKINFPTSSSPTGWVELKPYSVKLHKVNIKGTETPETPIIVKSCFEVPEGDAEISSLPKVENCNSSDVAVSEENSLLETDLNSEVLGFESGFIFNLIEKSFQSSPEEVYPNKLLKPSFATPFKDKSQNCFKKISSKNSTSELSEVLSSCSTDLKFSKRSELSMTTSKNSDFADEKCSSNIFPEKGLQADFQTISPPLQNPEKPFETTMSLEETISPLTEDSFISNESSSLKLPCNELSEITTSKKLLHYCHQCGKSLPSLKSFYYHVCHGKQKRGFPCKFCGKNFDFFHMLQKHKKSHALKHSLSCSDTIKSRHHDKILPDRESKIEKNVTSTTSEVMTGMDKKNMKRKLIGKENSTTTKLKPKKFKTKVFLKNESDATTSSGCYADSNFLHHVWYPDDSEIE